MVESRVRLKGDPGINGGNEYVISTRFKTSPTDDSGSRFELVLEPAVTLPQLALLVQDTQFA